MRFGGGGCHLSVRQNMRFKSSMRNSEGKEVLSMEGPGLLFCQGPGLRLGRHSCRGDSLGPDIRKRG